MNVEVIMDLDPASTNMVEIYVTVNLSPKSLTAPGSFSECSWMQ